MHRNRLEAFSDGVMAIILTIMVLELKIPHAVDLEALRALLPVFLSYTLSFIYLGIYWTNHHHLLHLVDRINGAILWANLHLLFWLSLVPFVTGWIGENHAAPLPTALYGFVLLMTALAWLVLQRTIIKHQGADSPLREAVGRDLKGKISTVLYAVGILLACFSTPLAIAVYMLVALLWLVPDRRIESRVG